MAQRKTPVRVFLTADDHSRLLIQAGTHKTTPSLLSEAIVKAGLDSIERGDSTALDALAPAPQTGN